MTIGEKSMPDLDKPNEAYDSEIDRLEAEVEWLRTALKELADAAEAFEDDPAPEDGGERLLRAIEQARRPVGEEPPR